MPEVETTETPVEESSSPQLIKWDHTFLARHEQEDWAYYEDHENFIKPYFSVQYGENEIVAKTLMEVNCIDSIVGKISISNDTIYLGKQIIFTDDRLCSEFHELNYVISNPENKQYTIVSLK